MHKTAASPLALIYAAIIVYASLYPFSDWRDQGMEPWAFLTAPPARYWTGFDVAINVLGYIPLGALLALSAVRRRVSGWALLVLVALVGPLLSLAMESLQAYLPLRVPSREDFMLNSLGAWLGGATVVALNLLGMVDRWSRLRRRWFVDHARGGLVLLLIWPLALLFPPPVPFGVGQVFERIEARLADRLADTPFLEWLPVRDIELQPLVPLAEMTCVWLGVLIPCLLGFCVIRSMGRRLVFVPMLMAIGISATALSAALSWGPVHAWAWLDLPAQYGLAVALVSGLFLSLVPARASASLVLLALGVYLSLLNQAPASPYFAQTLQDWEQGQFIRFHGLAQWLGWLWPYATLMYAVSRVWRRDVKN